MKVLLIGGTGFIGGRVAEMLAVDARHAVRAAVRDYRRAIRIGRLDVEWRDMPTLDPIAAADAASGCDAVVCCAHPFGAAREHEMALALCDACVAAARRTSSRRLVFLSSLAVYGDQAAMPKPQTPYGRTKLACERRLIDAHAAGDIALVVLRPGIVYGPFSHSWTAVPARQMADGDLVLPADASGACNAIHVDDVARMVCGALRIETPEAVVLDLNGGDRPAWREFYGAYAAIVRPGAVVEWPADRIAAEIDRRRRARGSWPSLKRAVRDRNVRERLNEIPMLAGLNRAGKSLGWGGLPAVDAAASGDAGAPPAREVQMPSPLLMDLYTHAPYISGDRAAAALGVRPMPLAMGMTSATAWLQWAGLAGQGDA